MTRKTHPTGKPKGATVPSSSSTAEKPPVPPEGAGEPCFVVAIGASEGSQGELEQLFTTLPADCGISFVVLMHLPAEGPSFLPELLGRYTTMPVVPVEDGMKLAANRVQVLPAGWDLVVEGDALHLCEPETPRAARHSIDRFFRSLAGAFGDRAVAVVLSGFGTDGAEGSAAVASRGGVVMVQDPDVSLHSGMPRAAIAAADFILPSDLLAAKIAEIARGTCPLHPKACHPASLEEQLGAIFEAIRSRTGHDFSSYKPTTVMRRVERRMAVNEVGGLDKYVALLKDNLREVQALSRDILIGVTSFFRDPGAFDTLRKDVIPRLFQNRPPDEPVRIWHACCATGEEVYSMAILIREYLEQRKIEGRVQFFATDIDEAAIGQARAALYADEIAAEVGEERLQAYFGRVGNQWQVAKSLREAVIFAHHSLIKDPPFSRLDLLVCRNFLIYLNADMQRRLIAMFHQVLRPGGFLFLGSAESVGPGSDLFTPVDKKWKIFQRRDGVRPPEMLFPLSAPIRRAAAAAPAARPAQQREPSPGEAAERLLVERYAPPCVVVNEKYEVIHVSTRAGRFLEVPVGEPTRDVLKMAREELRPSLRAAIYKAFAEGREIVFRGVMLAGGTEKVNVAVEPLPGPPEARLAMVLFEPAAAASRSARKAEPVPGGDDASKDQLIRQLEEQLRLTHEQLQATLEQLETSHDGFLSANEELMSINEEYQSANEELQSTNEELETSKEELQALNEELSTVNAELQGTVEELNLAHSDLENLLTSSEIATLFLDRGLRIKRYTPEMARILNLIPGDVGRPFRHLAGTIDWPDLARDAETVLKTLAPLELEVAATEQQRHYLMRVLPYLAATGEADGVVVTLVDLTERKRMEEVLQRAKEEWERTFDAVPDLIAILDNDKRMVRVNRALAERLGTTPKECLGEPCYRRVHGTDAPPSFCPHQAMLRDGCEHAAELHEERLGGDFLVTTTPVFDRNGRPAGAVHVSRDITEIKRASEELQRSKAETEQHLAQLKTILEHLSDGIVTSDLGGKFVHWNRAALAMHGFASEEECRARLPELADDFALSTGDGDPLPVEEWPLSRILRGETLHDWEVRVRRRDTGVERFFSYGGTIARDRDGNPLLAVVSVTDVTERRLTEELQARLAAVVEGSDDAIIGKDLEGVIRTWNAGAQRIFGYTAEQAVGRPISLLIPPELLDEEERILRRITAGERVEHFDTVRLDRDGRAIDVSVTVSPMRDRIGRIIGVSKIVRDISDRRQAEDLIRRSVEELQATNDELLRFNQVSVGRELRMVELKREINSLLARLGEVPRYPLDFDEGQ